MKQLSHFRISGLLPRLNEENLDSASRDRILEHAKDCADCRGWIEADRILRDALRMSEPSVHPTSHLISSFVVEPAALSPEDQARIKDHLDECSACRAEIRTARAALAEAKEESCPSQDAERESRAVKPFRWQPALAAAVLICSVGFVIFLIAGGHQPEDLELSRRSFRGASIVEARRSLVASEVALEENSSVVFRGGEAVVLGDGFSVGSNATFTVEIGDPTSANRKGRL